MKTKLKKAIVKIKSYKAFDMNLKCKDFQFEIGIGYKHEGEVKICSSGFHSCLNPFDCLTYYPLIDSRFCEVEIWGKIDSKKDDSKRASEYITVIKELSVKEMNLACIDFLINICKKETEIKSGDSSQLASSGYYSKLASSGDSSKLASSGDSSQLASSGDSSKLASSGDSSKLASSGYYSKLELTGKNSVGANIGIKGQIKGIKGTWITLAEYDNNNICILVLSAKIDGEILKEDTFYTLKNGEFTKI